MATYDYGTVFLSEMFGMWMVIVIALGGIANHVLNPTTGRGMGYGWIAMTFGFAFGFPIIGFGAVSAMFNPAAALALVTAGLLGGGQFFTVVAGELLGAFLGAVTVYLIYSPQLLKAGARVFKFTDINNPPPPGRKFFVAPQQSSPKQCDVEAMQDKEIVEKVVNPVNELTEDDDPFLGIFVTRPACWNPLVCLFTEFIATFIFLFLVLQLTARGQYLYQPSYGLYSNIIQPLLIGFIICAMILCMGPTGFAGNPARDLGPRLAHFLLPMPKHPKIGSEWWYAWVPVLGPLMGAVAAGGLYRAWVHALKGMVVPDANPWATNALAPSSVTKNLTAAQAAADPNLQAAGSAGLSAP